MSSVPPTSSTGASGAPKPPVKMIGGNLIGVVNEVHDALAQLDIKSSIDLPQIAVVGSQSSGKSSVLEAIVGRDFLPRGAGIVTRCPLILKLSQQKAGSPEWGEFSHKPGVKFDDFAKIRTEIEARTSQLATGLGISATPISLTIFSPNVLNLTLIDLPGIVSNAIGDQPKDIEVQIKNMVLDMIRPENTIILAISPANADLANSVALKAARSVDPTFERTLGVLTKIDLMDQGTNALETLEGRLIPLKRGWIGVVNRSQKAINENLGMAEAKAMERDFFANHPDYRHLADRMGTDYLAQTMSTILLGHIQKCLPDLRARIEDLVKKTRTKQEELGMLEDEQDKSSRVLQLIQNYSRDIARAINGEADTKIDPRVTQDELQGGARLHYIMYEAFGKHVLGLRATPQLTSEKLRMVIRNSSGLQASFFPSNAAFLKLTKEQISRLEDPALQCIQFIHDELRKITTASATRLERFPTFRDRVVVIAHQLLEQLRNPCMTHVKTWVAAEKGHINTRNPTLAEVARGAQEAFSANPTPAGPQPTTIVSTQPQTTPPGQQQPGGQRPGQPTMTPQQQQMAQQQAATAAALARQVAASAALTTTTGRFELPQRIVMDGELSAQEAQEHAALIAIVEGYFSICKNTLCDQAPKIISHLMILALEENINAALMKQLFKEQLFDDLLSESPQIAAMRKGTQKMMACLTKAQEALDKVRDMPAR